MPIGPGPGDDGHQSPYDARLLEELGRAIARGVRVNVVLSNWGATDDGNGAYYNAPVGNVCRAFGWGLRDGRTANQIRELLRERLRLRTVMFHGDLRWPTGRMKGNHAKFWSVDDELAYAGSFNLYPSTKFIFPNCFTGDRQESGVAFGPEGTGQLMDAYFRRLLANAREVPFLPEYVRESW